MVYTESPRGSGKDRKEYLTKIRRKARDEPLVILISHRLDDIFYVCDRVMALYHGRNFADGRLEDIERNEVVGWIMGNKDGAGTDAAVDHN